MAKILWISDGGRSTGFGTVTHNLAERLVSTYGHEIHVLAVGWDAAFPVETDLLLYRAEAGPAHSYLGLDRQAVLVKQIDPDLVVINEDIPMTLRRLFDNRFDQESVLLRSQPIISYAPVDGIDLPETWKRLPQQINVVPYTEFAAEQLDMAPDSFIYHGVDPIFRPLSKEEKLEQRARRGIPEDTFVIGRIDTNSGRKDWGATWKVINRALEGGLPEDKVVSLFHTKLQEPRSGVDLKALITRGGGKWMVTNEEGWPIEEVVNFINLFDVFLTTSRGEGFGLNVAQAMACGVPVIATECSSMPEVVGYGGRLYDPVATMTNPYGVELALADVESMAAGLVGLYHDKTDRARMAEYGMEHVRQFDWGVSAMQFNERIEGALAQT